MRIYGKIIETIPEERIVKIEYDGRLLYLYMTRKVFKDFGPYFYHNPYIFVDIDNQPRKYGKYFVYDINYFVKVVEPTKRERKIFYDIFTIKKGVKKLLDKINYKMFLDLEFSLPAYYQSMPHVAEIVQYGIVIEDKDGNIVFEDSNLVNPKKKYSLNSRTLKFLSRTRDEYDNAIEYMEFYELLEKIIKEYNPKIIAWGRSDMLALEQSFQVNKVKPLQIRKKYVNIMQVIKNYYNFKEEMGLFQTYQEMSGEQLKPQIHDALEDAMLTREIYRMFKVRVNDDIKRGVK